MRKAFIFCIFFWIFVLFFACKESKADNLTFDCTPAVDLITSAKIQFNAATPVDAPLVSTCGTDPLTKVTCTDPASKTICYPAPTNAFVATATVANLRGTSEASLPLSVPAIPSSPSPLRTVR